MIWVDREAKKIKERNLPLEWVDDMKTPSGRIHVGSLRGVVIHDLIYKALIENKVNAKISYVFNDTDPMDGLPVYLDKKWGKYMGKPLNKVPSPEKGFKNFAEFYAKEFIDVFNSLNCHPQIIWSSDLYASGKMNDSIKLFLDNAEKVKEIYRNIAKTERAENWIPFNPICEKCGNVGTTNTYKWDGEFVYYRCEFHIVEWANGCGHEGKISPFNGNGKLPWRLDWPALWKAIGVTIESSGKDHMSSGGSYDMASHFCHDILGTKAPYAFGGYEWFTIGGRKMSSSKGVGTSAKEMSSILPSEVFRFLLVRTPITTHLDFNPYGETIPRLFDDYDRCMNAYFDKLENNVPTGKPGEVIEDFARIAFLSQIKELPKKRVFLPRFRTVVNLVKNNSDVLKNFENQKKATLSVEEKAILEERLQYAKIYLEKYTEEIDQTNTKTNQQKPFVIDHNQKQFLQSLITNLRNLKNPSREDIQNCILSSQACVSAAPKTLFQPLYQALISSDFGPKAADLILKLGVDRTIEKVKNLLTIS